MSRVFELKKTSCNSPWLRLAPGGGGGDGAAGPVRVALAMAVVIVRRSPTGKSVALPPGGVLISVTHLPNPYNKLDATSARWTPTGPAQARPGEHPVAPRRAAAAAGPRQGREGYQAWPGGGHCLRLRPHRSPAVAGARRGACGRRLTVRLQHNDAESE